MSGLRMWIHIDVAQGLKKPYASSLTSAVLQLWHMSASAENPHLPKLAPRHEQLRKVKPSQSWLAARLDPEALEVRF